MSASRTGSNERKAPCGICGAVVVRAAISFEPNGRRGRDRRRTDRTLQRLAPTRALDPGWIEDSTSTSERMREGAILFGVFFACRCSSG